MNKRLKSSMSAVALACALVAPAIAAPDVSNTYFLNFEFGPGLEQFSYFRSSFTLAGQTFVDDYLFNAPPPNADVAFDALADISAAFSPSVQFTSRSLMSYQVDAPPVVYALDGTFANYFFTGATRSPLDSGVYVLEITGVALVDGGSYSGLLTANVLVTPVPEPETWALLMLGLGVTGAVAARRRAALAAAPVSV